MVMFKHLSAPLSPSVLSVVATGGLLVTGLLELFQEVVLLVVVLLVVVLLVVVLLVVVLLVVLLVVVLWVEVGSAPARNRGAALEAGEMEME